MDKESHDVFGVSVFQALKRARGLFSKHSYYNILLKTVSTAWDLFAITVEELSL
jgi:hypothetical protein